VAAGSLVKDWNTIVTIYQQGFKRAMRALQKIGPTERTPYYNVLAMRTDDPMVTLETIERWTEEQPALYDAIARVAPAGFTFEFHSSQDFRDRVKAFLLEQQSKLAGRSFHVRLHHRGSNLEMRTPDAERLFDEFIVAVTAKSGAAARVGFAKADVIIVIDTIGDRAAIAIWNREDLERHRLLRPD
jgi:tRNA(Ser,Leu) C12 N-acetylase TAN1